MAATIDARRTGTRVRLYPQVHLLDTDGGPVTVELAVPRGHVRPGPGDDRLYAVVASGKTRAYGPGTDRFGRATYFGPPWTGPALPPVPPDRFGDLDHVLDPGDPAFLAVHAYGAARFSLDVLESYCGRVRWHFAPAHDRLEVICVPGQDNAYSGFGFIELGENTGTRRGMGHPYALNLDTVAHEMGHLVLLALMGHDDRLFGAEFRAFHEAMADLAAFLVAAHLDAVLDRVLDATKGNLYVANELSRVVELSTNDQIRNLGHGVTMAPFAQGWSDEHDLSLPLGGAFFDVMVEVYQTLLVDAGVLEPEIVAVSDNIEAMLAFEHPIEDAYARAYAADPRPFKAALIGARDVLGTLLAHLWRVMDARDLTFAKVAAAMAIVERRLYGGRFARAVQASFAWRKIGEVAVGPRIEPLTPERHSVRRRAVVPG